MSFVFRKPVVIESRNSSSHSDSDSDWDENGNHYELMRKPEPDYDELLVHLSLYAFNRLSPGDQRKQAAKILPTFNVEDVQLLEQGDEAIRLRSIFAEQFRKLKTADENKLFLSKVIQKFKRERQFGELISSFKQLDAEDQQQLIDKIVYVTPENLRNPGETEEEFRLRRFTQLSRYYTDHVYRRLVAWKNTELSDEQEETSFDNENGSNWKSCFAEFFSGFSVIWFQGQSASGQDRQDMLIEQLHRGTGGVVIEKRLQDESEEQEETSFDNENGSNWKSCFAEFFLGFSIIWFQGQSASGQDMLIEQLHRGTGGVVIEKRLQDESEEDFKLRRFTELCKKVVDFEVQEKFLNNAETKLQQWGTHLSYRLIVEPQDSDRAAELLSRLWTFGVSLLSAKYQQQKIDEMSNQVESGVKTENPLAAAAAEDHTSTTDDHEEAMRIRRLTELFNQVPVPNRIDLFEELREMLLKAKYYSEAVHVFRGLGSKHQTKIIKYMFDRINEPWRAGVDPANVIVEKFYGENEDDFRFRRFQVICTKHISIWGKISWPEVYGLQLHSASDAYDEFLFGTAIIWFKENCSNIRRNPVQLILFGEVEISDTIEKQHEESEEEFRLRRFKESFKQLEFRHQERVLDYIQDTMSDNLGSPSPTYFSHPGAAVRPSEGRGLFDPEFIKYKHTNPRNQVAATTQGQAAGAATTQGQGTSQPSPVQ